MLDPASDLTADGFRTRHIGPDSDVITRMLQVGLLRQVRRIDGVRSDRKLICFCPAPEAFDTTNREEINA